MVALLGIFGFLVVLLRAAILCFQTLSIGGILFLYLVAGRTGEQGAELRRSCWKLIRGSALALALAQLFFIVTNSLVLTYSTDIPLRDVLDANFFWAGVVAALAGLAVAFWPASLRSSGNPVVLLPAALMLAASIITSHSASRMEDRTILVAMTTLHYLATATWIGGLPYLLISARRIRDPQLKTQIASRFSRLAQVSVAVLFLAGLVMSWFYVGSWDAMYGTAYGVMLGSKLALFLVLLLLGAANFYIVRGLETGTASGPASLVRFGEAEIGIGLSVILAAASMTSQPPGVDLTQDRVTVHEIVERFSPRMPRFQSPPLTQISESTDEILKRAAAQGKKLPPSFIPGYSGIGVNTLADIAWSEYNHNCAGLVVFLMGILALLSRSRDFSWAKIWPLAFLLLAVFLFFRADPGNWPLGPNGFWASLWQAEVLQHRVGGRG